MNRQSLIISAVLLGVLVVAGGVYVYLVRGDGGDIPAIPTGPGQAGEARGIIAEIEERRAERAEQPAARPEPRLIERPEQPTERPLESGAAAVTPEPAREAATGATAELDEAFDRALEYREAGQLADAQVLFFFGARQGHARSAFAYAEMNDPNHHSAETSLLPEPDANAALRFYTVALEGGFEDAAERIDALHRWAVDAAAAGDTDAEMLLLQWE